MLAPMIIETPAAIEKNAVAEGMSRMMGEGSQEHITTRAGPCKHYEEALQQQSDLIPRTLRTIPCDEAVGQTQLSLGSERLAPAPTPHQRKNEKI